MVGRTDDLVETVTITDQSFSTGNESDDSVLTFDRRETGVALFTFSLQLIPGGSFGTGQAGPGVLGTGKVLIATGSWSSLSLLTNWTVGRLGSDTVGSVKDGSFGTVEILSLKTVTVQVDALAIAQRD